MVVYQSYAAQQDDEDDENLEVFMFCNEQTGCPEVRPDPPCAPGHVYIQEWTATITT